MPRVRWLHPYYHVWPSIDLVGVEVCAALKNLFALGVGTVAGLLERSPAVKDEVRMHNPASALFAQALWEMEHVVARLGGRKSTVRGVGGAGLRCGVGEDLSAVPGKYRQRALPVSDRAAPSRLTLRDRCQSRHVLVLGKFPASVRGCPTPPPNRSVQTHGEGFVVAQVDRRHVG